MLNFNNQGFTGRGMGGGGNRLRDGSCLGINPGGGAGRGLAQRPNGPSRLDARSCGFFRRFLTKGDYAGTPPRSGLDWIRAAIDDLQQQINQLKNTSGK